ncbi:hypothetical protein ACFQ36_01685 [Arthrobacter sp. GCM10027362]|uniref:hypothetical protein n=1 Tax=Arthrobacter sp. GCM10027362 TaxID=3273379 RepID=UPI003645DC5E
MTDNPLEGLPERDRKRIDLLLALVAQDWKRTGHDQRFFQYAANLAHSLGAGEDPFMAEDDAVIEALLARAGHGREQDGQDATDYLLSGPANARRLEESIRRLERKRSTEAAQQRRIRIAAARLRCTTDSRLGRKTPQWVIDLAQEDLWET